jgi:hypothetical protein
MREGKGGNPEIALRANLSAERRNPGEWMHDELI